jgi:hypothetical protein
MAYFHALYHKGTIFKEKLMKIKCLFRFLLQPLRETFIAKIIEVGDKYAYVFMQSNC